MADEEKLVQAQGAAKLFLEQMRPRDQIAVLSFADEVDVPQKLTRDRKLLSRAIDRFAANGNTRLYDGLAQSLTQLSLAPGGPRAVVLLTDGRDTASMRSVEDNIAQAVSSGVPVYTIGLGSDVDTDILQKIATSTGGRFFQAPTGQDLALVFRRISGQLTSQYEVSWISTSHGVAGQEVPALVSLERTDGSTSDVRLAYTPPTFTRSARPQPNNPVQELADLAPTRAPTTQQALAAGLVAGLATLLLFFGVVRRRVNRRLNARLLTYVAGRSDLASASDDLKLSGRRGHVRPLTALAARVTGLVIPSGQIKRLRRKLIQAGHPSDQKLSAFLAIELALAVLLAVGAYEVFQVRGPGMPLAIPTPLLSVAFGAFGLYLPYMWLRRRVESRQRMILRSLPDALDLMAIAVSAGQSLDSAMTEVVQKWDGELSRELNQVLNEMRMGVGRRQALLGLAERTQLPDVQLLVAALVQAEELGANISETLVVQAEQLRVRRHQVAEEKARKAPVKMLIPLVGFMFPAMFVVLLAPAILQIGAMLHGLSQH